MVSQTSDPNPFTAYRLLVTFTSPDEKDDIRIPGFYAGDGHAEYSDADSGNVWMAYFTPEMAGAWNYSVSFQQGADLVLHDQPGEPITPDGFKGTFSISESDKTGKDFRARGFLKYNNQNYYYFSGENTPFLKNGTGSPENLLYYHEFDNTYQHQTHIPVPAHQCAPHVANFNAGDP
jgi:hypothetical protein